MKVAKFDQNPRTISFFSLSAKFRASVKNFSPCLCTNKSCSRNTVLLLLFPVLFHEKMHQCFLHSPCPSHCHAHLPNFYCLPFCCTAQTSPSVIISHSVGEEWSVFIEGTELVFMDGLLEAPQRKRGTCIISQPPSTKIM